ncbi:hypothetical protein J2X69_002634 [Algoriphagus sp. 4150]|uniref:nuclear transport factor 2 family protein n=1 Tax=Algoriphagus sp. 4150 TaxID=2817756 RepID=UPI002854448E|nr:nuclear transport factor 2 family protein [Algoriphagus sp. 4150]MDR7130286.1 hypothetical protein [Algoriphagus sp. 4150]
MTRGNNHTNSVMKDSMDERERIIENYIAGYNEFDLQKMVRDFSGEIVFQNIQNGQVSMVLTGLQEFINQAEVAKSYFSKRKQTITSFKSDSIKTVIEVDYFGVLATDFPNGMKKGDELRLHGKSTFEFRDNKIIKLVDES